MKLSAEEIEAVVGVRPSDQIEFDTVGKLRIRDKDAKLLTYLESERYLQDALSNDSISAIITTKELGEKIPDSIRKIITGWPKFDFARLHNYLVNQTDFYKASIHWKAGIDKTSNVLTVDISNDRVAIGSESFIDKGVIIKPNTSIGSNVTILPYCVIGEDGEEYATKNDEVLRLEFGGGVIIQDGVKIQSHVSIKKGLFGGSTVIGKGTALGSFVNVGHDVVIGTNCYLTPGTVIPGSCRIGNNCLLGVNSCLRNDVRIGDNCIIGAGSVVTSDIPSNKIASGVPAKVIKDNKP